MWTHIWEVPDGRWGAGDRPMPLESVVIYVAAGWGGMALTRFESKRHAEARAMFALAQAPDVAG